MLNRSAITVRAQQPFLDRLKQLPDPVEPDTTLENINADSSVYLLPELVMEYDKEELLEQSFDIIFEMELEGWWEDESGWPQERDLEMFNKWFNIEFHSVIEDLVDENLVHDD